MPVRLIRQDLLELEGRLRDSLAKVLRFETHALYFPRDEGPAGPVWIPEERRLLLPLRRRNELLGVFMARNADPAVLEPLLNALPGLAELCLDNLELYKAGRLDACTGLAVGQVLAERTAQEAAAIRAPFGGREETGTGEGDRGRNASMGLVLVRLGGLADVARDVSHAFAESLAAKLAGIFLELVPEQAPAARTGQDEFAVLLPGGDRAACRELAEEAVRRLGGTGLPDPFTGVSIRPQVYAGYALYPQDMDDMRSRDMSDPAPVLLRKAGLAADAARVPAVGRSPVMGWGRLLHEGGVIRTVLPLSRVKISLGRSTGAREGRRFAVWSTGYQVRGDERAEDRRPLYKGEIVLLEVQENESLAEILHLGDPAWTPEPGDTLTLLEESGNPVHGVENAEDARRDPLTGLLRHGDFLAAWSRAAAGLERFALVLLQVDPGPNAGPDDWEERRVEQRTARVAELCRTRFREALPGADKAPAGRFALNTLIFFHPDAGPEMLCPVYESLCAELTASGLSAAAGLACLPFLDFRASDMLECARKALEYARLLPAPHVGVFDSLALNISADKRHCRGDVFGAVEEYKSALLADPDNALAWNSLGVCMAGLGRPREALRYFEEAHRRVPEDPSAAYNLGVTCAGLGDDVAAERYFLLCLTLMPGHPHALIRLGLLAEKRGLPDEAARLFAAAADAAETSALPRRHLARLAFRHGRPHEAREHLHQALLRDPRDGLSLSLMAELYLEGGEDPELAGALARRSVALNPERKAGWRILARALEAAGQSAQARDAWIKAGEL